MDPRKLEEAVAMAEDTYDLLDHIAWTDVIKPRLLQEKDQYTKLLVRSILGNKVIKQNAMGMEEISREQLAGRVDGIEFIIKLIEDILKRGKQAFDQLNTPSLNS